MALLSVTTERAEFLSDLTRTDIETNESAIALAHRFGGFMENAGDLISNAPNDCAWGLLSIIGDYLEPYRNLEDGKHLHDVFVALQVANNTAWRIGSPLWQAVVEMVRLQVWQELCVPLVEYQHAAGGINPLLRALPSIDPPLRSL